MTNQTTIFDQVEKRKLEGIELVYAHADTYWKRAAAMQLQAVIASGVEFFSSDNVLIPLEERGITTHDTRALAAILLAAKRMNLIEPTDSFIRCQRRSRHHAPIMQWRVIR